MKEAQVVKELIQAALNEVYAELDKKINSSYKTGWRVPKVMLQELAEPCPLHEDPYLWYKTLFKKFEETVPFPKDLDQQNGHICSLTSPQTVWHDAMSSYI